MAGHTFQMIDIDSKKDRAEYALRSLWRSRAIKIKSHLKLQYYFCIKHSSGFLHMYYVYLIRSLKNHNKTYIGYTTDIEQRMQKHNNGASVYTSGDRPWKLVTYICFDDEAKAIEFEKYLKVGSGHAFAQRRLW